MVIMFRFKGFRASLNFSSGKTHGIEYYDKSPGISLNGAYRSNKDELFGHVQYSEPRKAISPSLVKLPTNHAGPSISQSKSTSNLTKSSREATNIRRSAPDIPQASNSQQTKTNVKEQTKIEKQRIAEQKKQEKLAAKERQREEKLRKEREKHVQKTREAQKKSNEKKPKKRPAPQPQQQQMQQINTPSSSHTQNDQKIQYSTTTLESSISKSSGPPPYSSGPEVIPNQTDDTGNTSFVKPADDMGSWEIISQHRQQMSKHTSVTKNVPKQRQLDLHYNVGTSRGKEVINSDA